MGGPDTIKGISFQTSYILYRIMELIGGNIQIKSVHVEGKGEDVEDGTVSYVDGTEEVIQLKKRETIEGPLGIWGLADVKPVIQALFDLSRSGRPIRVYRFVSNANAHERVIAIQKTCQRIRQGDFAFEKDSKALTDVKEMTGAGDQPTMDFMGKLWLDIPSESEAFYVQAVQNKLMKEIEIPSEDAEKFYNHLYKQVLDRGKENSPELRMIDQELVLSWLERVESLEIGDTVRVKVRQHVQTHRGRMIAIDAGEKLLPGIYEAEQKADNTEKDSEIIGVKLGKKSTV